MSTPQPGKRPSKIIVSSSNSLSCLLFIAMCLFLVARFSLFNFTLSFIRKIIKLNIRAQARQQQKKERIQRFRTSENRAKNSDIKSVNREKKTHQPNRPPSSRAPSEPFRSRHESFSRSAMLSKERVLAHKTRYYGLVRIVCQASTGTCKINGWWTT